MHRADPFMLDDEIADDTPAPPQAPVQQTPPPAPPREPVRVERQPAPTPVARQAEVQPEPETAPEPKTEMQPRPTPQPVAPKPASAPVNRTPGKRGRPKSSNPKRQITLRLDPEIIAHFKAQGRGWQTRINSALRVAAGINSNNR